MTTPTRPTRPLVERLRTRLAGLPVDVILMTCETLRDLRNEVRVGDGRIWLDLTYFEGVPIDALCDLETCRAFQKLHAEKGKRAIVFNPDQPES